MQESQWTVNTPVVLVYIPLYWQRVVLGKENKASFNALLRGELRVAGKHCTELERVVIEGEEFWFSTLTAASEAIFEVTERLRAQRGSRSNLMILPTMAVADPTQVVVEMGAK